MKYKTLIGRNLRFAIVSLAAWTAPAVSVMAEDKAVKFDIDNLQVAGMPADVTTALADKLLLALSRTEAVDVSKYNVFHIIPAVDFTEAAETEGLVREVARVQADLKLTAYNVVDGTVYNSVTIPLKGSAPGGKDAAMRKLVNSLKPTDPVFVRFVRTSRQRIQDHYADNCGNIIAQAQRLMTVGRYDEAASYLSAVPPSVPCFDQSEAMMGEVVAHIVPPAETVAVETEVAEAPVETPVEQPVTPEQPEMAEQPAMPVESAPTVEPTQTPATPQTLGDVTIDGEQLDFEVLSCKGNLKRRTITITARVLNEHLDDAKVYVNLNNAITADGNELKDMHLNDYNYHSGYVSMPENVPVKMNIAITGVRSRVEQLTYVSMTIRGIPVIIRNLPVSW